LLKDSFRIRTEMPGRRSFRPIDLARAAGVSPQSVRQYEAWGFLPLAERSQSGYRQYTERHVEALRTSRALIAGYGWKQALELMRLVHAGRVEDALAEIDKYHAAFHQERLRITETLAVLKAVADQSHQGRTAKEPARKEAAVCVGEAARQAGVRISTIRFWEQQGFLHPNRDSVSNYRVYDAEQLRRLQVIALLRRAGYGFGAICPVVAALSAGRIDQAIDVAQDRLRDLAKNSYEATRAAACLWSYLVNFTDSPGQP
jgi:DNA-binding transcriptional MerR regulator